MTIITQEKNAPRRPSAFARLAGSCHDHRRLVAAGWVIAFLVIGALSGAVGNGFRDEFNLPDVRVEDGLRHPRRRLRRPGHGHHRHDRVPRRAGRRRPRGAARDAGPVRRGGGDRATSTAVESPYAEGGERLISSTGPEAGKIAYANVEMPDDIEFPRRRARSATRSSTTHPTIDGLEIELGGVHLRRVREAVVRGARPRVRHRHPDPRVRLGAGDGPARRRRAVRHRHRHRDHHAAQQRPGACPSFATFLGIMIGLGVGIDYALLIVTRYREQLHARPHRARVDRHRHRHRRPVGAVRRHHRRHLAARHAADGRQLRAGPRGRRGVGRRGHRGRVAHAAAGAARLRRRQRRAHPLARPHRRRPRRGRPRSASGSKITPLAIGLPLALIVLDRRLLRRSR